MSNVYNAHHDKENPTIMFTSLVLKVYVFLKCTEHAAVENKGP